MDFPNFCEERDQDRTREPQMMLVMLVCLQNAAHNRPGERQGGSQRRQTAKQNKVQVRERWVKEGQKVSGDQNALILPSRTFQTNKVLP